MKNCKGCKYAEWEKSKNGSLHPSGKGVCKYKVTIPKLPASMWWSGYYDGPGILGGDIKRHSDFNDHCPFYGTN